MMPPVQQTDVSQAPISDSAKPQGKPDREEVNRFRDALARKGTRPAEHEQDANGGKDGSLSLSLSPPIAPFVSLLLPNRPMHDISKPADMPGDPGAASFASLSAPPRNAAFVSVQPLAAPAADVAGFAALVARLDSGLPPSALSHLALPGDLWRADHVVIDQQAGGLSVTIDMGGQGDASHESLAELQERLRARGMNATVSEAEPNRIAELDSRIA